MDIIVKLIKENGESERLLEYNYVTLPSPGDLIEYIGKEYKVCHTKFTIEYDRLYKTDAIDKVEVYVKSIIK